MLYRVHTFFRKYVISQWHRAQLITSRSPPRTPYREYLKDLSLTTFFQSLNTSFKITWLVYRQDQYLFELSHTLRRGNATSHERIQEQNTPRELNYVFLLTFLHSHNIPDRYSQAMREEFFCRATKGRNVSGTLVRTEGKMRNMAITNACFNWRHQIMWRVRHNLYGERASERGVITFGIGSNKPIIGYRHLAGADTGQQQFVRCSQ